MESSGFVLDEWEDVETDKLPHGYRVFMITRGNEKIYQTLRAVAIEARKGNLLGLKVDFVARQDFFMKAQFSYLVDPHALNLPGQVEIYQDDSVAVDEGVPAPIDPDDEITDVGIPIK